MDIQFGLISGQVRVIETTSGGCVTIHNPLNITVNQLPITTISADKIAACDGDTITFSAGPAAELNYEFFVNGGSVQSGVGATYPTAALLNNDVVTVTVTDVNGCTDTHAGITMTVETVDPPTILGPVTVCNPSTVTYTVTDPGSYSFLWTVTNGTIIGSDTNSTVDVLWNTAGQGTVSVGITSVNSCTNLNNITVDINGVADTGDIQSGTSLTRR